MVSDGVYMMDGLGLVLCNITNITIKAVNFGQVKIRCQCFNCSTSDSLFGNIYLENTSNIAFIGIVFEECGYNASNLFIRETQGVTLRNCTFR